MGWFSSICSFVGNAVKSVASALTGGVGNIVKGAADWIKKNILGLEEAPEYDIEKATVDETKKINELLDKCISSYSKEAEEFEDMAKLIINEQFDGIVKTLNELNSSNDTIIEGYIIKNFRMGLRAIEDKIDKLYSMQIIKTFSLNNNYLLDILKKPAGREKKRELNDLAIDTLENANDTLVRTVKNGVREQQDFIIEILDGYIQQRENACKNAKLETERIIKEISENIDNKFKLEEEYKENLTNLEILEQFIMGEVDLNLFIDEKKVINEKLDIFDTILEGEY